MQSYFKDKYRRNNKCMVSKRPTVTLEFIRTGHNSSRKDFENTAKQEILETHKKS